MTSTTEIQKMYRTRVCDIRRLLAAYKGEEIEKDEDSCECISEYGYAFDFIPTETEQRRAGYFSYLLAGGGPAEEIRFYTGPDLKVYSIEYVFFDWFHSTKIIVIDSEDFDLLHGLFEWLTLGGHAREMVEASLETAGDEN